MDMDKGDRDRPNYRPRLAAVHHGQEREDNLYAAAPPIESLRAVLSSATTGAPGKVIVGNDVSPEYDEDTYVERGKEDRALGDEHCWKLVEIMYGTRTAARMCQHEAARTL